MIERDGAFVDEGVHLRGYLKMKALAKFEVYHRFLRFQPPP